MGLAELGYRDSIVMLASVHEEMGAASPQALPGSHGQVMCYVDDVDAHYERAVAAGAKIVSEPEDKYCGDRMCAAEDPEGHRWYFGTHVRDVPPEEMVPPSE